MGCEGKNKAKTKKCTAATASRRTGIMKRMSLNLTATFSGVDSYGALGHVSPLTLYLYPNFMSSYSLSLTDDFLSGVARGRFEGF
jgi:hypothetical protein